MNGPRAYAGRERRWGTLSESWGLREPLTQRRLFFLPFLPAFFFAFLRAFFAICDLLKFEQCTLNVAAMRHDIGARASCLLYYRNRGARRLSERARTSRRVQ